MAEERKVQLGVEVDATGAKKGFDQVKQEAQSMAKAVSQSGKDAGKAVDSIGSGGDASAKKVDAATRSMIQSIQRTTAVMEAGSRSSSKYFETLAAQRGVNVETLKPYLAQLDAVAAKQKVAEQALSASTPTMQRLGASAAQTAAAMRQVPAQFTDIVTALQSGQKPMTVLLQQGGQLKDAFGGIGPAAKALGGYVTGLINPLTLTAGAVLALGVAYSQGSKEADAYAKALIMSGNAAGTTVGQLQAMAVRIDAIVGTQAAAAEALAQMAGTGRIAAGSLEHFATVAIKMERDVGIAVSETVKNFEQLGKSPVEASLKLNEQYRYLTAAVYEQIRALKEQGKELEAAALAQKTFANAMAGAAEKANANLGLLERGWRGVKDVAKEAWDAMLGIGRKSTVQDQIDALQKRIDFENKNAGGMTGLSPQALKAFNAEANARLQALKDLADQERKAAEEASKRAAAEAAGVVAVDAVTKANEKSLSKQKQLNKALEEYRDNLAKIRAVNPGSELLDPNLIANTEKSIRAQYADKEALKGANRELAERQQLLAKLAGVNGDYIEQLNRLQVIREKNKWTEEQYVEAVKELIGLQPAAKKFMEEQERSAKSAAEARADLRRKEEQAIDDYFKSQTKGYNDAVKSSQDALKAAQDEYAQLGLSKSQIAEITLLTLQSKQAKYEDGTEGYNALQKQIEAQKELIGVLKKTDEFNQWKDIFSSIDRTAHDTFTNVLQNGKNAFDRLRDSLKSGVYDLLYQMTVKKWIFQIGAAVSGQPGLANAGGSGGVVDGLFQGANMFSAGQKLWSGFSSAGLGGFADSIGLGGAYNTVAGWFGSTGMGLTGGAGAIGSASSLSAIHAVDAGYYGATATGVVSEAGAVGGSAAASGSSIGSALSAAGPYLAAAAVAYAIWKSMDDSGTPHSGGAAEANASGVKAIDGRLIGTAYIEPTEQGTAMAKSFATGIATMLNSTAATFGKTAGYEVATAFADDSSKDGAWGALFIKNGLDRVVDWNQGRTSDWAPREYADGEAGQKQYSADLGKSVRDALEQIGLPGWAKGMLDQLGDAPTIEQLGATVDKINAAQLAMENLGNTFSNFANLSDEAVSGLIKATGGVDALTRGASFFSQNFLTEAERLAPAQKKVSETMAELGYASVDTKDEFKNLVNGLDLSTEAGQTLYAKLLAIAPAFVTVADAADALLQARNDRIGTAKGVFADSLYTDSERAAKEATDLADGLAALGLSSIKTREQFRAVVDSIDTTTDSGLNLYEALAKLAPAFGRAVDSTDRLLQAAASAAMGSVADAFSDVQRSVDAERKRITTDYNDLVKDFNDQIKGITGSVSKLSTLSTSLKSTLERMRMPSEQESDRAAASAEIQTALVIARAGGVLPDADKLSNALNVVSQTSEDQFSSFVEYQRYLLKQRDGISELAKLTDNQLSVEEEALQSLQDQLKLAEQDYTDKMAHLDSVVEAAQAQLDVLNGVKTGVTLTIPQAIAALQIKIAAATVAQGAASGGGGTPAVVAGLYQNILGRDPEAAGAQFWTDALVSNPKPYSELVRDFIGGAVSGGTEDDRQRAIAWARANGIQGFDVGTNWVDRDRLALIHEGERILPRADNEALIAALRNPVASSNALVEEFRALRVEVRRLQAIASEGNGNLQQLAEQFDNVTEGGNAMRSEVVA